MGADVRDRHDWHAAVVIFALLVRRYFISALTFGAVKG